MTGGTAPASSAVVELVGVYHADGGVVGEVRYVVGKLLGRAHCGLCDITHGPVRRKHAWDALVADLGVPFRLYHLDEMPPDVAAAVAGSGAAVVLGRDRTGELGVLLGPVELDAVDGSVPEFARALRAAMSGRAG